MFSDSCFGSEEDGLQRSQKEGAVSVPSMETAEFHFGARILFLGWRLLRSFLVPSFVPMMLTRTGPLFQHDLRARLAVLLSGWSGFMEISEAQGILCFA